MCRLIKHTFEYVHGAQRGLAPEGSDLVNRLTVRGDIIWWCKVSGVLVEERVTAGIHLEAVLCLDPFSCSSVHLAGCEQSPPAHGPVAMMLLSRMS